MTVQCLNRPLEVFPVMQVITYAYLEDLVSKRIIELSTLMSIAELFSLSLWKMFYSSLVFSSP
jgi:hypothetical protein